MSEYCGTNGSPSCACQLYLTVLGLFCDCCNCGRTTQANHSYLTFPNFPDFSPTNVKFPAMMSVMRLVQQCVCTAAAAGYVQISLRYNQRDTSAAADDAEVTSLPR